MRSPFILPSWVALGLALTAASGSSLAADAPSPIFSTPGAAANNWTVNGPSLVSALGQRGYDLSKCAPECSLTLTRTDGSTYFAGYVTAEGVVRRTAGFAPDELADAMLTIGSGPWRLQQPLGFRQLTAYVNPFVGTADADTLDDPNAAVPAGARGGTFPGATLPFGMVQWSPMTTSIKNGRKNEPVGYIHSDQTIIGFPLTQMSGSGCGGNQGALPIMPTLDPDSAAKVDSLSNDQLAALPPNFSRDSEVARPGYYKVTLADGIGVELTATTRVGIGSFTFPQTNPARKAYLVFNARKSNDSQATTQGYIDNAIGPRAIQGWANVKQFCADSSYRVYFYAEFDRDVTVTRNSQKNVATVSFDASQNPTVLVKVGISHVSAVNAKANLVQEAGVSGKGFPYYRDLANDTWNSHLNLVQLSGGTDKQLRTFYTAFYHSLLSPNVSSDTNGQYVSMKGETATVAKDRTGHYSAFSNWDIYRSQIQLISLLFPDRASDMMQSLVEDAKSCGGLPRWKEGHNDSGIMPGDSGVATVVGAYSFGAQNFDTTTALQYMRKAGEDSSTYCNSVSLRDSPSRMDHYLTYGYVPSDDGWWAGSIGLEFSAVDFAIWSFAHQLGDTEAMAKYAGRGNNWISQFNTRSKQAYPRSSRGSWASFISEGSMVEGNPEQYTWMMTWNTKDLFSLVGGTDAAVKRLDRFFSKLNAGTKDPYFYIGNEPNFAAPWLYNWAGKPTKTQALVHKILDQQFSDSPGGLPGNDDLGALSSWYVWASIGLFPAIPQVPGVALSSPSFDSIRIFQDGVDGPRRIIAVTKKGTGPYIDKATLGPAALDAPWLDLDKLLRSELVLQMTTSETVSFGTGSGLVMPSYDRSMGPRICYTGSGYATTDAVPCEAAPQKLVLGSN